MKNEMKDETIFKELDSIYGIDENKWEIYNYIKYLEISKEKHFANYNIIIHNKSGYASESEIKLLDFLCKMLKKNNIIKTDYEFIKSSHLRKYDDDKNDDNDNDRKKVGRKTNKTKKEKEIEKDLVIIDSDKIGRSLEWQKEEIISMIKENKNKIFIILNKNFFGEEVNTIFNKYFDWYFEINDISEENKKDYIKKSLNKNEIKIAKDCTYIDTLTNSPFYLIKTKINNIVVQCQINNIKEITDDNSSKFFEKDLNKKNTKNIKINQNFNSLIGIENIKEEVNKVVNYVKICQKRKLPLPTLHMCFTGNPGTGKTTIARIIGNIFKEEHILSTGNFVEVHGRDLIARYVGWTAKEVQSCVRRAKGGILFIDEAYSLNSDRRGSFEDEAIATLIKEMEDKRDDLCVILAGYQNEMNDLIKLNPGFESRIQFYINFPNYNPKELYEIFKNLAKKEKYKISNQVKNILYDVFEKDSSSETFANGRYVRNLYEKVKIEQANRVALNEDENYNLIKKCDIENVIREMETIKPIEIKKNKIGFAS